MSELKLEVGKRYLTRDGQVALITGHGNSPSPDPERARLYEFAGTVDGEAGTLEWRGDGVFDDDQGATMFDLIREIIDEPAPLRLQVGKRYRDGHGNEVTITLRDETLARWQYVTGDGTFRFDERGESIIGDVSPNRNLVSEITDSEPAPPEEFTPPEFVEAPSPLQLEVGKFYRARNGEIAEVFAKGNGPDEYHAFSGKLTGAGTIQWSADGRYWDCEDDWDLIEEVPAPVAEAVAEMEFEAGPVTHVSPNAGVAPWDTLFVMRGTPLHFDMRPGAINKWPPATDETRADRAALDAQDQGAEDPEADEESATKARSQWADARDEFERRELHQDHLKMGHSVRFANYARAILFVMLGVAAMTFATRATAKELLVTPNNAGGEIVLTDVESKECGKVMRVALARSGTGEMVRGCWLYTESNYVYVKWGEDVRMYRLDQFEIPGRVNDEPVRPDHLTPWRGA